jgi:hypothetical protein
MKNEKLYADLSRIHLINNYKCNWGASFEDAIHYFRECPLYLNERRTLLTKYTHDLMTAKQNTNNRHLKF